MENKEEVVVEKKAEVIEPIEQQAEETVILGTIEKLKNLFSPKEQTQDIDSLVEEKAKELVNQRLEEILPKVKKNKEAELDTKIAQVEQKEKDIEVEKSLENVQDNFKEFVKFQAEQKKQSISEYLSENVQYTKNTTPKKTEFEQSSTNAVKVSREDAEVYKRLEKSGLFRGGN